LRVSSVAVMACHGKVHPIESQEPKAKEPAVPRILSGVQPTGSTHLGNYVGARQWADAAETGA
jgi:tRNA synthetases class I (W and Y)